MGLSDSTVSLGVPLADALTSLQLEFVPHMTLALGESVWLGLPGFSLSRDPLGDSSGGYTTVDLDGHSSDSFRATWENATEERPYESVRLRVTSAVTALAPVALTIAASAGTSTSSGALRVPALGLRMCDGPPGVGDGGKIAKECLSLSTDAAAGPVPIPVPVEQAPAVGSFGRSSTVQW